MPISLIIEETACQPIITDKLFFNVTMFQILFHENDCHTVYHTNVIMIHSLVYGLGLMKKSYRLP